MDGDLEPGPSCIEEQARGPFSLLDREQDPLAGRAEREDAVEPAVSQIVDVGAERLLVESVAPVAQGRDGCCESASEHEPTLSSGQ